MKHWPVILVMIIGMSLLAISSSGLASGGWRARPFNTVHPRIKPSVVPIGLSPTSVRAAYQLTGGSDGSGTIAVIDAYDAPTIESDLATFDQQFGLSSCTTTNNCFEKHKMSTSVATSAGWSAESSLDVEWAHAIAPAAKVLLVEAKTDSRTNLLAAVNYARSRADVVAVSMSWGGSEFATEKSYEADFVSPSGAAFFASSGDDGHGVSWPAASANVISVGGSTLQLSAAGKVTSETAWTDSGGGQSSFIAEPAYQVQFGINRANGHRAVPDVAYSANPAEGFPIYDSTANNGGAGWFIVGGTSAGAPQWAALRAIDHNLNLAKLYLDGTHASTDFHDIISGSNGSCSYYCTARSGYDYVTGLGSPLTLSF